MSADNDVKLADLEAAALRDLQPTDGELVTAARLEFWGVLWSPVDAPVLHGEIHDAAEQAGTLHFAVGLVALEPDRQWARTAERLYRLGRAGMGALTEDWE